MKILICGVGSIGKRHMNNLMKLGYKDIILYRTGNHTIENDENLKKTKIVKNLDKAFAMNPDVTFVTNPTSIHIQTAIKAAKNGSHIFLEKPISDSMEDVGHLKKLVNEKNLVTFVGCQFRFHPLIMKIKKIVDSGEIGKIFYARAEWSEYLPDWHPWEDYKIGYSARKDLGGGVMLTQIHPVDYLYWILGQAECTGALCSNTGTLGIDVEDIAEILLKFKNGAIGNVHVDYIQKPHMHTLSIIGLRGKIFWDYHKKYLEVTDRLGNSKRSYNPKDFEKNDMFVEEVKHFLECVHEQKQTINPLEHGIDTLKIVLDAKKKSFTMQ